MPTAEHYLQKVTNVVDSLEDWFQQNQRVAAFLLNQNPAPVPNARWGQNQKHVEWLVRQAMNHNPPWFLQIRYDPIDTPAQWV